MSISPNQSGFTLLEMLVAVTIMGLISVGIAGGLTFGISSWSRSTERVDKSAHLLSVRNALFRLFEHARADFASENPLDTTVAFDGAPNSVVLISVLPDAIEPDVIARQSLAIVQGPEGRALKLRWQLDLPPSGSEPLPATEVSLTDEYTMLQLRYWGQLDDDNTPAWHSYWARQHRLPEDVHIALSNANNDLPLTLDVRLRATATSDCHYDAVSFTCFRR